MCLDAVEHDMPYTKLEFQISHAVVGRKGWIPVHLCGVSTLAYSAGASPTHPQPPKSCIGMTIVSVRVDKFQSQPNCSCFSLLDILTLYSSKIIYHLLLASSSLKGGFFQAKIAIDKLKILNTLSVHLFCSM